MALPEERLRVVHDAFAGVIVGVGEEHVPVLRQGPRVHSEAVVLTGDEAALGSFMDAGLVVTTVPVPGITNETLQLRVRVPFMDPSLFKRDRH